MKRLFVIFIYVISVNCFCQKPINFDKELPPLDIMKKKEIDSLLISDNKENLYKITPIELLQYLMSEKENDDKDLIKSFRYIVPKDWFRKEYIDELIQYVYSTKPAYKINSVFASMATLKKSTVGYEAIHLLSAYRYENFNYPALCFLCYSKDQEEMADDFVIWWKTL